jgi:hypothetical protein
VSRELDGIIIQLQRPFIMMAILTEVLGIRGDILAARVGGEGP